MQENKCVSRVCYFIYFIYFMNSFRNCLLASKNNNERKQGMCFPHQTFASSQDPNVPSSSKPSQACPLLRLASVNNCKLYPVPRKASKPAETHFQSIKRPHPEISTGYFKVSTNKIIPVLRLFGCSALINTS